MTSLVQELQSGSLDPSMRVSDLLRQAKAIAYKLNLPDLASWVDAELNGYKGTIDVPKYRHVSGTVKAKNPFHGWQPVIFGDRETEKAFSERKIGQKIAEIEDLHIRLDKGGFASFPLDGATQHLLMQTTGADLEFTVVVSPSALLGILDAVRNALLDWSLKLEAAGIVGGGMSFTREEQKRAQETQAIYNIESIGTFTGNMGSGSGSFSANGNTVNAASPDAILRLICMVESVQSELSLSKDSLVRLQQSLASLTEEANAGRSGSTKAKNALATLRNVVEGAAGSLVASGLLYEVDKLSR